MPLLYLPNSNAFFLWDDVAAMGDVPALSRGAEPASAELVTPAGRRVVEGAKLPLVETMATLAAVPAATVATLPASLATWVLASKLAIELVARERVVPTIVRHAGSIQARWAAALSASEDATMVADLARSMPPAAHAVPVAAGVDRDVWAPEALLRAYLDAIVDGLVRSAKGVPELPSPRVRSARRSDAAAPAAWEQRWRSALEGQHSAFEAQGFAERSVVDDLQRWSEPALGARDRLRACFRLELPERDGDRFVLRFLLQSPDDPSLLVAASDVWKTKGRSLEKFGRAFRDPQESLLEALGRAARLFSPIERALATAKPELLGLDPVAAWEFLGDGAAVLAEAGFGVIVPGELTAAGQRRLRLRMRVGSNSKAAGAVAGAAGLGLDELLAVDWQAAIGDDAVSAAELAALAKQKAPLVRYRGAWVAIDPRELAEIRRRIAAGQTRVPMREAVLAALAGETRQGSLCALVSATGSFAEMLGRMRDGASADLTAPASLRATLRPYQQRGLAWLATMGSLGLGACLADDMGLGKTIQLLAFLLRRAGEAAKDARPTLLVAPTSVVGNWEREVERFAPSLWLVPHYGAERLRRAKDFPRKPGSLVMTTYGLLRRDAELLAQVDWSTVVLDEAQNIKNSASATARAARTLRASHRFALTGTPVENRLAELWSILEFANPGLLGPLETFRREFAMPIERYGDDDAAERLRRIVSPFLLRRLKSDPAVIKDLPAKNEMKVICTLTREQATLYKAVVDEEMRRIEDADGIERRGRVLALLLFLKQICNHPAHYLSESGPLARRSGKLARTTEMLEEAIAAGDKALVFTQFREMGDRLVAHLGTSLGCEVVFLHGGTPKKARDEMVRRFQEEPRGPRVFVLSLKAGGTGLNLTAASHVFHYDRWWNPAVEDQATDRAYRIGQKRTVQVHKLVCAGTVEEKVDRLLEQKRELAAKVVGSGEKWITEMGNSELRDLFALSKDAVVGGDQADEMDEEGNGEERAVRSRSGAKTPASRKRAVISANAQVRA
ncbi:MAG: DEAD/DEAH box helicase [Deltaproteobacteria bacterium]|nr:DEAD/DEAH box helicase [Deltaproteobacteria bacterium]